MSASLDSFSYGSYDKKIPAYNANTSPVTTQNDPIIVNTEILKTNDFSLSKQYSNIIRLVQQNSIPSINWQEKGITLNNAIESLTKDSTFNSEMKNMVLGHIGKTTNNAVKLAILEKGLAFLETERTLSNLVKAENLSLEDAKEMLTKSLDFGCQKDFSLEKLNEFNTFLENSQGKGISEKLDELFNPLDVANAQQKSTQGINQSTPHQIVNAKLAFEKLSEYPWGNNENAINGTIKDFLKESNENFDKKLFNTIQKTLVDKKFGIDEEPFNAAWAWAISTTQGGEIIKNDPVNLKFGEKEIKMQMTFTPQAKLSGFPGDTTGMKHCSSVYQSANIGDTKHAVNLWRQDITLPIQQEIQPMSFLRHAYILEQETAAKEILANACCLQHGEEAIFNTTYNKPLSLKFSNIQLMSFGKAADKDKPWKQMKMFNSLAQKQQPLELTYGDKKVFVKLEQPLLFNFGTNLQHFRRLEIGNSDAKKQVEKQNLESFKQLFGENFPNIVKAFGKTDFNEGSLIKKKLDSLPDDDPKKQQIQTLANQILEIYQSHPEGLKENPYALPTRVLALTNLLGYASSFNCKSGKDRTGVCAMELSNLCAQMMSGQAITDPMQPISDKERKNLQAIYKEGSCVKDIPKINTVLQTGLKTDVDWLFNHTNNRFGVDLTKSFEENVESF